VVTKIQIMKRIMVGFRPSSVAAIKQLSGQWQMNGSVPLLIFIALVWNKILKGAVFTLC
jgi:hypothetical protein